MPQALESLLSIVPWPTPSRPSHLLLPTNVSFHQRPLSRRPVVTIRTPKRKSDQPWPGDNSLACLRLRRPTARLFPLVRATADGNTSGSDPDSSKLPSEVAFDIKLPRRSLLVEFTCDSCGERTKRLINRVAYEKGTIFLQCAGCLVYHKFVDNLGLVVEYDLREELNEDSDVT